MGYMVRMKNPKTGKEELCTAQNALDLEQHLGWKRLSNVRVKDNYMAKPQEVLDKLPSRRQNAANSSVGPDDDVPEVDIEEVIDGDAEQGDKPELDADADSDGDK